LQEKVQPVQRAANECGFERFFARINDMMVKFFNRDKIVCIKGKKLTMKTVFLYGDSMFFTCKSRALPKQL
jgi:hypothetical protein